MAHLVGGVPVGVALFAELAVVVEYLELVGGQEEGRTLALAVNIDEQGAELLESGDGNRLIVHVGLAPAVAVQPPRQNDLVLVEFPGEDGFNLVPDVGAAQLETAGDAQLVGAGAEQVRRAALAQQQADGAEQQRFAGAGLTRPDAEARA